MMASEPWSKIVECLRHGGIILYPTEGVWGLGCDPFNEQAVQRLLQLKQRTVAKGLILLAAAWEEVNSLITVSPTERQIIADNPLQMPTTWLLTATHQVPCWITGHSAVVAIRVTTHPLVQHICQSFGGPVVSTSANFSQQPAPTSLAEVDAQLIRGVDLVVPGQTLGTMQPSRIYDFRQHRYVR